MMNEVAFDDIVAPEHPWRDSLSLWQRVRVRACGKLNAGRMLNADW
jgi:hypothetical protein